MDYAQGILAEQARRGREVEMLKKKKTLPKDSHLIKETLSLLLTSSYTAPALAKNLDIEKPLAVRLIRRMVKLRLAQEDLTRRGNLRIKPLGL